MQNATGLASMRLGGEQLDLQPLRHAETLHRLLGLVRSRRHRRLLRRRNLYPRPPAANRRTVKTQRNCQRRANHGGKTKRGAGKKVIV